MTTNIMTEICALEEIVPGTGVAALVENTPIAVFRLEDDRLFAIGNVDPVTKAGVLSRGIVGDKDGMPYVASPLLKHKYALETGQCLDDQTLSVPVYAAQTLDGKIYVQEPPKR